MAGLVAQYAQGAFSTPINGTIADATVVLSNDNATRVKHNSHDADPTIHIQSSSLASRPAAGTAQRVWITTDGLRAYVDSGAVWAEIAYLPTAGGTVSGNVVVTGSIAAASAAIGGALTVGGAVSVTPTLAAGAYSFTVIGTAGAARDIAIFGQSGHSNGLTVQFDGSKMVYTFAGTASTVSMQALTATTLNVSGEVIAASFQASSTGAIYWAGRALMRSPADGIVTLLNSAETGFTRLQFGGTTSSFPALKRSTSSLHVRFADDSDYAGLVAGALTSAGGAVISTTLLVSGTATFDTTGTAIAASGDITIASTKKLYLDGGGDTYIDESTGNIIEFIVGGTKGLEVRPSLATVSGTFTSAAGLAVSGATAPSHGIQFGTSAPGALADGQIWYDGTNFKVRTGGATKTITIV